MFARTAFSGLRLRARLACLLLALAWSLPSTAATLTPEMTPEAVAAEAHARMRAGDWNGAAEAFDPAALKEFRQMFAPILEGEGGDFMVAGLLGEGRTAADAKKMNDVEFFAAFIRSMSGGGLAGLGGRIALGDQQILGSVPEGAGLTHVVARTSVDAMGINISRMEVVTLRRTAQGWRLALSEEMQGFAELMRKLGEAARMEEPPPAASSPESAMAEERRRQLDEIQRQRRQEQATGSKPPTYRLAVPREQAGSTASDPPRP